ncbi:COX15/CtaA family protein [Acetobacteraceae bacterium KSS12]|uniref:Heme A synthase n=2 Tax=Rhizosaccharibacter radicis TaxID=2782605 RepID=A0ABT1W274_9PROT|nr:COX15/CtaA family protein [Acetobacteraceae bacterium KSS12]
MLLGMIALGGATRLTGSGLSIMEWQPIMGALPPLSHADWEEKFALYKQIPQYRILHQGFGLAGFQHIFWLEWIHRFWGRLIGLTLFVPLLWFAAIRAIDWRLGLRLVAFFVLGGLQGAIGWFMVASGFDPDSTAVAPAKLVLHLCFALALYAAILWTALSVRDPVPAPLPPTTAARATRRLAIGALGLAAITIVAGGFTAGTHAGFSFNSFPLMDGRLVPAGYASLHPFWRNWFGNIAAVQFDHRLLATLTALLVGLTLLVGLRAGLPKRAHDALMLLGWALLLQYALGVTTLLLVVPVWAGTLHQFCAALLLTQLLVVLHRLRGATRAAGDPVAAPAA